MKGEVSPGAFAWASDQIQHGGSTGGFPTGGGSLRHHFNGNIPCLNSIPVRGSPWTGQSDAKVLAVVIASTRAGHLTFPSFKLHLLDPLRADLALAVAVAPPGRGPDLFRRHAKYVWEVDEPPNTAEVPPKRIETPNYRCVEGTSDFFAPCISLADIIKITMTRDISASVGTIMKK